MQSNVNKELRIATRGSALALVQAKMVAELIGTQAEICTIKTTGDIKSEEPLKHLGGKEVFTKEIDLALIENKADIAVHSLKDVPAIIHPELEIIATLPRGDCTDILIGNPKPEGVFGTSSPRRKAQILSVYPNAKIVEFRGNVETRLQKLKDGVVDATILAAAGINRLGIKINLPHKYMDDFIPAAGQGIICIMAKYNSIDLTHINHIPTFIAAKAERQALKAFGGNCYTSIAVHATVADMITIKGFVASDDGLKSHKLTVYGLIQDAEKLGYDLGKELLYWYNDINNQTH